MGLSMRAPAKINLFLHVAPPRPDGYHELEALAAFTEFGDRLSVEAGTDLRLEIAGPFAAALESDRADNIVLRATRRLLDDVSADRRVGLGATLRLEKNLPVASGIGGGSSDAAAALRLLAAHWSVEIPPEDLDKLALELGADVPVCLHSRTAWMSSIGDRVEPAPALPPMGVVLVNPQVAVSTRDVYRALDTRIADTHRFAALARPGQWAGFSDLIDFLRQQRNDLEPPAIGLAPPIADVLEALAAHDAALARMSGSGATCVGLFARESDGDAAADRIRRRRPDWWVVATQFKTD